MNPTISTISARAAVKRLQAAGVPVRAAREALASGLAGEPGVTAVGWHYDAALVDALAERPQVTAETVQALLAERSGLFVARRAVDVIASPECQLGALRGGWPFRYTTGVWIKLRIIDHGSFPFVATVGGFVAIGADATDVLPERGGTRVFDLAPPGPWFEKFRDTRLPTGKGRPWVLLEGPPTSS